VTLSRADYLKHLENLTKPLKQPLKGNRFRFLSRSPICRNVEFAEFIFQCSKSMMLTEIYANYTAEFGKEITPSISAIQRLLTVIPRSFYEVENSRSECLLVIPINWL